MTPTDHAGAGATSNPPERRGFIILIVLVVLAILSAVVVSQLAITGNNTVTALRSSDDAKARALAEGCLTMLQEFADAYLGSPAPLGKDFDQLLNPNDSATIDGDEFVPQARAGETVVTLPKGLAGSLDFVQRHKWLLIPQPVGSEQGACLVRFDDNSDESLPLGQLPPSTVDDPGEGLNAATSTDIPFKDRDKAIYLTAIGLFPFSSAPADAYAKAHAHVTLRRLYNAGSAGLPGSPAILAAGDVSGIKGSICGGGIVSSTFASKGSVFSGPGCGCGIMQSTTTPALPPACPAATCPLGCTPPVPAAAPFPAATMNTQLNAAKPPGSWSPFRLMDNQTFFDAPTPGAAAPVKNMGGADLGGGKASCKLLYSNSGEVFVWDRLDATPPCPGGLGCIIVENCTSTATSSVQTPCTWTGAGAGSISSCAPFTETPCWKRVHSGGGTWKPNAGAPIPNVIGGNKVWNGAVGGPTYLCGDPATFASDCASCDGVNNDAGTFDGTDWTFAAMTDADLPVPSHLAVETNLITSDLGDVAGPLHASLAAQGNISGSGKSGLCGAGCDCSAMGGQTVAPASCTLASQPALAGQTCWALRAGGTCSTSGPTFDHTYVGAVRCGAISDQKDGECYVGDVAGMSNTITCGTGSGVCGNFNICWKKDVHVVGNIYSNSGVNTQKTAQIDGNIAAQGDVCPDNGGEIINGSIVSAADVYFKGGANILTFTGGGPSGPPIAAIKQMMETSW